MLKFAARCGTTVPDWLRHRFDGSGQAMAQLRYWFADGRSRALAGQQQRINGGVRKPRQRGERIDASGLRRSGHDRSGRRSRHRFVHMQGNPQRRGRQHRSGANDARAPH